MLSSELPQQAVTDMYISAIQTLVDYRPYIQLQIEMRDKETNKLIKASSLAAEKQVEHLLLIKKPDKTVKMCGTRNIIEAFIGNNHLFLSQPNSTRHNPSWSDNVIGPSPMHSHHNIHCIAVTTLHQKLLDHFQSI